MSNEDNSRDKSRDKGTPLLSIMRSTIIRIEIYIFTKREKYHQIPELDIGDISIFQYRSMLRCHSNTEPLSVIYFCVHMYIRSLFFHRSVLLVQSFN